MKSRAAVPKLQLLYINTSILLEQMGNGSDAEQCGQQSWGLNNNAVGPPGLLCMKHNPHN